MIATPDGDQTAEDKDDRGIVQVKMSALAHEWKEGVPPRVWCQMQHEMAVTGREWGTAVAFLAGREVVWADVERDDRFIDDTLIPRCRDFWNRVVNHEGIPPHWIDGSDDEYQALKAMFPERLAGSTAELGPELVDVHERMQEMKTLVSTAEREIKAMENRLRLAIGEHTYGRFGSGLTYSLKTQTREEYVAKACTFRVLRLMKGTVN
jgi:predicted phage-related endonuclease